MERGQMRSNIERRAIPAGFILVSVFERAEPLQHAALQHVMGNQNGRVPTNNRNEPIFTLQDEGEFEPPPPRMVCSETNLVTRLLESKPVVKRAPLDAFNPPKAQKTQSGSIVGEKPKDKHDPPRPCTSTCRDIPLVNDGKIPRNQPGVIIVPPADDRACGFVLEPLDTFLTRCRLFHCHHD